MNTKEITSQDWLNHIMYYESYSAQEQYQDQDQGANIFVCSISHFHLKVIISV